MLFSKRHGQTPTLKSLQKEKVDLELRNRLWNAFKMFYWNNYKSGNAINDVVKGSNLESLVFGYWHFFFKWSLDDKPYQFRRVEPILKEQFYDFEWFRVYDFIEFTINRFDFYPAEKFPAVCNQILEEENAAYRIIDGQVTPITSEAEIQSLEDVVANADSFPGVREHISSALRLLSDRESPDYRNSVKESISAVESVCQSVTGDNSATLGDALNVLERHGQIHGALKAGMSSLYGYTSDADGIRHAILKETQVTFSDAKFMLLACSAFVNYVIGKAAELEIDMSSDT
jgi:hypothetical protein